MRSITLISFALVMSLLSACTTTDAKNWAHKNGEPLKTQWEGSLKEGG
jgi:hypothetical protein